MSSGETAHASVQVSERRFVQPLGRSVAEAAFRDISYNRCDTDVVQQVSDGTSAAVHDSSVDQHGIRRPLQHVQRAGAAAAALHVHFPAVCGLIPSATLCSDTCGNPV